MQREHLSLYSTSYPGQGRTHRHLAKSQALANPFTHRTMTYIVTFLMRTGPALEVEVEADDAYRAIHSVSFPEDGIRVLSCFRKEV